MSGTSLDGVDGVLAEFNEGPEFSGGRRSDDRISGGKSSHGQMTGSELGIRTLATASLPFPSALRERLIQLQQPAHNDLELGTQAGLQVAELYSKVIDQLMLGRQPRDVRAVGAHGQTVRHRPQSGYTIQLLSGAHLAERCGIDVICDFRAADLAAGGQGAPLVPGFHRGVFAHGHKRRAIVNIGGIANVSLLAPGEPVRGFDTGPGNTLLDAWAFRHQGQSFDDDGQWSSTGKVDADLLRHLLDDDYFARSAPKSTHRDYFTLEWLNAAISKSAISKSAIKSAISNPATSQNAGTALPSQDVQASLAELTARSIASAVNDFGAEETYICGGGAKNADLMRRLAKAIAPITLDSTSALGVDPQSVEALAFAWLARQRLCQAPGNEYAATGAKGPRVLGAWYRSSNTI